MSDIIKCGTHGKQETTFVCAHIIQSLKDGEERGFCWNKSDGDFQALCSVCNDLSEDEFQKIQADIVNALCFGCFQDAAALNGIEIA